MPLHLPASARRLFGSLFVFEGFLLLRDIGQHFSQPLVLDNSSLIDLLQSVERPVRQVTAFVLDRKPSVGVVEHGDALAGEGAGDLANLGEPYGECCESQPSVAVG